MRRKHMLPPLHPIHPRTLADVKPGSPVVVRDAHGGFNGRIAVSGVVRGADFLVVWVCRDGERDAALREGRHPDAVPWPAEDVWLPGDEPRGTPREEGP